MCWWEHPTPVYFSRCKHTVDIPPKSTRHMCPEALSRSPPTFCNPIQNTTKTSSTNCRDLCPNCRHKTHDPKGDGGSGSGAGALSSTYGVQPSGVQVGA